MARNKPRLRPTWSDVKAKLADFDRAGLLDLVHDLYGASPENKMFLHTRFAKGEDSLNVYKETIDRWLWPNVLRNQDVSVVKARQAISSYKKATSEPAGLAELMVFYCERAVGFCRDIGYDEEHYLNALVRMFEEALTVASQLPASQRDGLVARLDHTRAVGDGLGYGVGDDMYSLLAKYAPVRD
jgi:hypothetical protein